MENILDYMEGIIIFSKYVYEPIQQSDKILNILE